ncbi:hypothetical protein PF005_g24023 [Phytophthora fragariae]|uniref:Uncharacterized protein n=1 Tax=Phytophthora fragariae TaxID=53985 RepID=A0A6A3QM17_9STRA|nr:hypothetical protein PF003_g26247 [Phytophthora fragariae]KAE8925109.1 hypothetical protein PF009_g24672 [Phytophthora fragariae]KAE8979680.1 hypothetical protein PF011_g22747 [Phytophthora fragariae]KAE9077968.1 hypothetical protein PF007_g24051 [Phytophthora fragariae]KAE9078007.1 hypothetical protein PF010_g23285 [Phytophthora fragariae]
MPPHRSKEEKVMRDRGVVMGLSWYYIKLLFLTGFGGGALVQRRRGVCHH